MEISGFLLTSAKDNFSKRILHYASTNGKAGGEFFKNLFLETFEKYNLLNVISPINTLSDNFFSLQLCYKTCIIYF
jgi:hypothetical protein